MSVTVDIKGLKELDEKIKKMSFKNRKKILTSAVRKAANVVKRKAKKLVPVEDGDLKKKIRTLTEQSGDGAIAYVDSRHYTSHMIEFGTAPHGGHPGTAPRSFIRAAFGETKDEQLAMIQKAVEEGIDKVK